MSTYLHLNDPLPAGSVDLSIALIGPNDTRRRIIATALAAVNASSIREFSAYPNRFGDVPRLLEQNYDVVIIDLDSDLGYALELVEKLASAGTTVMVYSMNTDSQVLMSCMRAGAREFFPHPVPSNVLSEALARASARRPQQLKTGRPAGASGKVLVLLGGKGGSGVTTVASNLAVSLVRDCSQNTLLIDLDLPLGDAALNLGINPQFSSVDALQNHSRIDQNFLTRLLSRHGTGLQVLAAPGKFPSVEVTGEAAGRLISVARQMFDFVVIDAGSRFEDAGAAVIEHADTVYLVMQAGIAELRNSHRVISEYFKTASSGIEIVLNRFMPRSGGIDEEHIAKALTRPVQWKIPSDYLTVRRMQNEATPLVLEDSIIARAIQDMARDAAGMEKRQSGRKRAGFSLFG